MIVKPIPSLRPPYGESIRIRGTVQGVGFRPTVWSLAQQLKLQGSVQNDGYGVLITAYGPKDTIGKFVSSIKEHCPPLAVIDSIQRDVLQHAQASAETPQYFIIDTTTHSEAHTHIPPDSATCRLCIEDINNPANKRFAYPFTNCTHCGPRLSIIKGIPYDRAQTSMLAFDLCDECQTEYSDPSNRRFHAQPNACSNCGPEIWLEDASHKRLHSREEALTHAVKSIKDGKLVAIKGIGGFHIAVDANNPDAIAELRKRKHRPHKPLALMAKDIDQIKMHCYVEPRDEQALLSSAAPIVLLNKKTSTTQHELLSPQQTQLGFMLPYSPLHHLLMQLLDHPIVLTSGNLSNEPQCIDNDDARMKLCSAEHHIADVLLLHDREIENRMDDSVIRYMAGAHRVLRRARGYAPAPIKLHNDFTLADELLAMGGELKNTFCLFKDQHTVLSQHIGDLESYTTFQDYQHNLQLYKRLYQQKPKAIVIDKHPEYLSSKLGKSLGEELDIPVIEVQHHHAHIAACLAENHQPLSAGPVLGIALDGLGFGDDGTLWGGEFLLADYKTYQRLACFKPMPLIGGTKAMQEPWRNTYAHLHGLPLGDSTLWDMAQHQYGNLDIVKLLSTKPLKTIDQMIEKGINSPLSSSCGRLFDAVAAALGICSEHISYEGQAAVELESLIRVEALHQIEPYPFNVVASEQLSHVDPVPMWQALLEDLTQNEEKHVMSARFHLGLAQAIIALVESLIPKHNISQVVLTGGVMQNKTLLEALVTGLQDDVEVLTHRLIPANDGGLALGQAAIAAARQIDNTNRSQACA